MEDKDQVKCCCAKPPWWARQIIKLVDLFFIAGVVLAMMTSWEKYHHKGYSLFTAFAGWFYVLFPGFYDGAFMA